MKLMVHKAQRDDNNNINNNSSNNNNNNNNNWSRDREVDITIG
jgi:hypothetical protein